MTFPHYDREETGYGVLLVDTESGLAVGLHQNTGNHGEQFDECRTGLDHIGFNVGIGPSSRGGLSISLP